MPRGKYVNHKGRSRHFTAPEELEQQNADSSEEETSEEVNSDEEGGATGGEAKPKKTRAKKTRAKKKESSSDSDSEESEEDRDCKKGVAGLIEIENPNRQIKKATVKLPNAEINETVKPELLPSDEKLIAKQEARKRYEKLHAEGKTHQAKADLARLAIIRQQREEAAAKRDAEKKALEDRKTASK